MSNIVCFGYPAGFSLFFSEAELEVFSKPVSQEVITFFYERYHAAAEKFSIDKGLKVVSFKAQEVKTDKGSIYVISAGAIQHHYAPGYSIEEMVIGDAMVRRVMKGLNAHYYASEREGFFISTGVEEAYQLGKSFVIVEDLS